MFVVFIIFMTDKEEVKFYSKAKVSPNKEGEVEISAEVPTEVFNDVYEGVVEQALTNFEAPGFRKGKAPKELFMQHANLAHLLEESASESLKLAYPQIIADEDLDIVSNPEISITKLAPNNPMTFVAKVAVAPKVDLANYKSIAKKIYAETVPGEATDDEVRDVLKRFVSLQNKTQDGADSKDKQNEDPLKMLTDEFVKTLGPFTDVKSFLTQVRKDLTESKKSSWKKEKRETLAKELVDNSKFNLSKLLLSEEWDRHAKVMKDQLIKANLTEEDYAKQLGIEVKDFIDREKEGVEKQLRVKFILRAIADEESIKPNKQEIAEELEMLIQRYPEADPVRAHAFIEESLSNEATLKFLEKEGGLIDDKLVQNQVDKSGVDVGGDNNNNDQKDQKATS